MQQYRHPNGNDGAECEGRGKLACTNCGEEGQWEGTQHIRLHSHYTRQGKENYAGMF